MTKMVRCTAGLHQYDADRHSICPHCSANILMEDTQPSTNISDDKTRPVRRFSEDQDAATLDLSIGHNDPTKASNGQGDATKVVRTEGNQPVVGWLVIVEGAGKGISKPLYHGVNTIGRAEDQTISLKFEADHDDEIARDGHAKLTYDPKGKTFYIQHGEASNLTYLNDAPLLEPKPLQSHDQITIGKTRLLFIPLCNDKFDWDNL